MLHKSSVYTVSKLREALGPRTDPRPLVSLGVLAPWGPPESDQFMATHDYDGVDRTIFALRTYYKVGDTFTVRDLQAKYKIQHPDVQATVERLVERGEVKIWDEVANKGAPHYVYQLVKPLVKYKGETCARQYSKPPEVKPGVVRRWFDI